MLQGKLALVTICVAITLFLPSFVFGQDVGGRDYGLKKTADPTALSSMPISKKTPEQFAADIVQNVLIFVGTIFFLLILYAGVSWMLAQGSSEKVVKAKGILTTAIIGLIIVAASYAISTFVFTKLSAATTQTTSEGSVWCQTTSDGEPVCTPITNTTEAAQVCTEGGGAVVTEDCSTQ